MTARLVASAAILLLSTITLHAGAVRGLREFVVQPLASPEPATQAQPARRQAATDAVSRPRSNAAEPTALRVYPVAGRIGYDLAVPYFVDLDPTDGTRDFNCTHLTFNGHTGHDAYVRSFTEQRIGVPVFAARDGVVIDMRDGEPDENVTNETDARANYITLRHDDGADTQYVHLRKGITLKKGDFVTAGTQIGFVGSSGQSTAPHLHFEVRQDDVAFEPMAGPCRAGRSYWLDQPDTAADPIVLGATFSRSSFANYAPAPHDDAPHTGTFVVGPQTVYLKADMANVGGSTRYRLLLVPPGSSQTETAAAGTLLRIDAALSSIWWGIDVNLDRTGQWMMILEVNEKRTFSMPFSVVASQADIVNRPPNPISATIEPVILRPNEPAVCRADTSLFADPDYDVVRYTYEWRVEGNVVRSVTTAAETDVLARQFVSGRADLSCTVTASDGKASGQPVTAFATVPTGRRRAAAH